MSSTVGNAASMQIEPSRAVLLIIDIQERLARAMPDKVLAQVERNVGILCEMARCFEMPILVSEQYPKGLGKTTEGVEAALAASGDRVRRFEKLAFGVCESAAFAPHWQELTQAQHKSQWIVTGMECHVCVYQAVRQLVARGATVHLPTDAVLSRAKANWLVGSNLIERAGGILTSTEVLVFDALRRADSEHFKTLSKLVR
jgi:isochorismate hydrolase